MIGGRGYTPGVPSVLLEPPTHHTEHLSPRRSWGQWVMGPCVSRGPRAWPSAACPFPPGDDCAQDTPTHSPSVSSVPRPGSGRARSPLAGLSAGGPHGVPAPEVGAPVQPGPGHNTKKMLSQRLSYWAEGDAEGTWSGILLGPAPRGGGSVPYITGVPAPGGGPRLEQPSTPGFSEPYVGVPGRAPVAPH